MKFSKSISMVLFVTACMVSYTANAEDAAASPTTTAAAAPAAGASVNAKTIEVAGRPTVERLKGDCHLLRGDVADTPMKVGFWLKPGDVLDIAKGCTLTIGVTGHKSIPLTHSGGQYIRIESKNAAH